MISKEETTIIDGAGTGRTSRPASKQIRAQIGRHHLRLRPRKLQERLAKLAGGVAVIKVGAATEVEMKEKKARVEDALHATRAAVEEGIVRRRCRPGACPDDDGRLKGDNHDQDVGIAIARRAMEETAAPDRGQRRRRASRWC